MVIGLDFDGTCVTHAYPEIGKDIGAEEVIKRLIERNHKIILFTMRGDKDPSRNHLREAVDWFSERDINLYGVQTNPTQKHWTSSPKAYAELYIDDAALGCPLKTDFSISERPFVDWNAVEKMLIEKNIL